MTPATLPGGQFVCSGGVWFGNLACQSAQGLLEFLLAIFGREVLGEFAVGHSIVDGKWLLVAGRERSYCCGKSF